MMNTILALTLFFGSIKAVFQTNSRQNTNQNPIQMEIYQVQGLPLIKLNDYKTFYKTERYKMRKIASEQKKLQLNLMKQKLNNFPLNTFQHHSLTNSLSQKSMENGELRKKLYETKNGHSEYLSHSNKLKDKVIVKMDENKGLTKARTNLEKALKEKNGSFKLF